MSMLPSKNSGFTLVEVMIAVFILMVGLLALLQSVNVAISQNLVNTLRDEGVSIAEQKMNEAKSIPFDSMTGASTTYTVTRQVRSTSRDYTVIRKITSFSSTKKIQVLVNWTFKGSQYQHQLASMRSQ